MGVVKHIAKRVANAPLKTGVYLFLNRRGQALYVGKAINIRQRLKSHLADAGSAAPAKVKLLAQTRDIRWEVLLSEPEALIREAALIKKLKPPFNILLRDDKNYLSVGFTKEPFPKIFLTHQPLQGQNSKIKIQNDNAKLKNNLKATSYKLQAEFIGPFTDAGSLKRVLKFLRRTFPYCICRSPHRKECLAGTLGRCISICCLKPSSMSFPRKKESISSLKKRYRKNIKALQAVLRGEKPRLLSALKTEMRQSASTQRFEEAARLRDQIEALGSVFAHRAVVAGGQMLEERKRALRQLQQILKLSNLPSKIEMYDMSNIHGKAAVGSLVVFTGGIPDTSQYRKFRIKTVGGIDDVAMMREVIMRRLTHSEWELPGILIVDGGKGQISAALAALRNVKYQISNSKSLPVLGLAKGKDELHIATPPFSPPYQGGAWRGRTLPRSRLPRPVRHLFNHLQAEAHRFAITYHKKVRSKSLTADA